MPQFTVDDEVAALVERLARKAPFENLTFNDALRRVLLNGGAGTPQDKGLDQLNELLARARANKVTVLKKAPSPSAAEWASGVAELKNRRGLHTWKAICDVLNIHTGGDSARRRLKNWVRANRPSWPEVPEV